MPDQPKTPHRTFRIPDAEYTPALEKAKSEGTNLTSVVREKLREWVEGDGDD